MPIYSSKKFGAGIALSVLVGVFIVGFVGFGTNLLSMNQTQYDGSGMPLQTDIFRGSFIPESLVGVGLNTPIQVSFSITPIMGTSNTTIKIFLPHGIVDLVDGDLEWKGDVKKDETVTLKFTIKVTAETDSYIRAYVTSYINGVSANRSYYLHISSVQKESGSTVPSESLLVDILLPHLTHSKCSMVFAIECQRDYENSLIGTLFVVTLLMWNFWLS